MPESHSRAGKRVEQLHVTDEPHERYRYNDPWTGVELDHGIPILMSTKAGNVLQKDVRYSIIDCPECERPARYTHDSEPVCPNCGIICAGKDVIMRERIVRDAKAAGRLRGDTEEEA